MTHSYGGTLFFGSMAGVKYLNQFSHRMAQSTWIHAVGRQQDTRRATYKDYDRSARLCCVGPGDMEQPSRRTVDFNSVH